MSELTSEAVKLSKLGRVLAGVADGVAFMDNLEDSKLKLEKEIKLKQDLLASVNANIVKANGAVSEANKLAAKIVQEAKDKASEITIKADGQGQDIMREANAAKNKISADAGKITEELAALKRAREVADAGIKKAKEYEADIMARIEKVKEEAKRNLGL